jgi:hypothetical protein
VARSLSFVGSIIFTRIQRAVFAAGFRHDGGGGEQPSS